MRKLSRTILHRLPLALAFFPFCLAAEQPLSPPPSARTLYVPTSASIHGSGGAFFHTDLWAFNRSFDSSLTVSAIYRCFAGPCVPAGSSFTLAPRESKLFTDVGVTLFALPETAGAIELTYTSTSDSLAATTRTYTPNLPSPTNGTAIPAVPLAEARTRALFLGLGSNGGNLASGFRTNVGAYNQGSFDSVVTYTLLQQNGALIGSATRTLSARTAGQINDIFLAAGAGSTVTTNAVLVVTSTLPVFPFVTVVDNQSGDSVYAAASSDQPASPSSSTVVNGGFDTGLGSWTNPVPSYLTMSWSPTDATGSPSSGSVQVTIADAHPPGSSNGPTQCVALTPGSLVNLSVRTRVPSGQSSAGSVSPTLYLYGGSGCSGTEYPYLWTIGPSQLDTWETLAVTGTIPANVHSGSLLLWVGKTSGTGTFVAYLDDVSVVSSAR
jgi:hypothetical protein